MPAPESLLVSKQSVEIRKAFKPTFTSALLTTAAPTALRDANETCSGLIQCVHDYLMSNSSAVGRQTAKAFNDFKQMVTLYGKNFHPFIRCFTAWWQGLVHQKHIFQSNASLMPVIRNAHRTLLCICSSQLHLLRVLKGGIRVFSLQGSSFSFQYTK